MTRLRVPIVVAAALVLTSLAAVPAAASASGGFVAGQYPAAVKGTAGTISLNFPTGGYSEFCHGPNFEALLEGPSRSVLPAATGNGSECGGGGSLKMNGCTFEFHRATNTADIGPAGCGPIEAPTLEHCGYIRLYPRTGLAATFENSGSGSSAAVKATVNGEKLKYEVTEGAGCKHGTFEDGSLSASWELRAYQAVTKTPPYTFGEEVGISTVSEAPRIGIFMDSKGLDASQFPVSVTAAATEGEAFTLIHGYNRSGTEKWSLRCSSAAVDGGSLNGPSAQQSLASFSGCSVSAVGPSAKVTMNSCSYKLSTNVEIACTTPGDSIKVEAGSGCTITIPAQVINSSAPTFTNEGEGSGSNVTFNLIGSGEKDSANSVCQLMGIPASGENGTTSAGLRMTGASPWYN